MVKNTYQVTDDLYGEGLNFFSQIQIKVYLSVLILSF